ncbi:binding--dependent transport system inner membrane component family protein, partial [Vibrio cholerae HC-57A1]
MHEPSQALKLT